MSRSRASLDFPWTRKRLIASLNLRIPTRFITTINIPQLLFIFQNDVCVESRWPLVSQFQIRHPKTHTGRAGKEEETRARKATHSARHHIAGLRRRDADNFDLFRYNRYLSIAGRAVRRSLKEDKRIAAERRGNLDVRFSKWQVSNQLQPLNASQKRPKATRRLTLNGIGWQAGRGQEPG